MVGGRQNEDRAMNRYAPIAAIALSLAAGFAGASEHSAAATARQDRCATAPHEQFRAEADLQAVVEKLGYQVVRVGTDAGCYAVRAEDRRGKRYDIRFEGANLRMVSRYTVRTEPAVVAQR
jgi:hypothetical protein